MSNGQTMILNSPYRRMQAKRLIDCAPEGAVLNIKEANRTTDQNALMWTLLSYIARAKPQGRVLPTEIWKALFMASCGHKVRFEPALDGDGVVAIGFRSSRLSKLEMSEMIEAIYAYGAEHGVVFGDDPAIATEAGTDMTGTGMVHEGAVPQAIAHN